MPPRYVRTVSPFNTNNAVAEHTIPEHSSVQLQGIVSHIRSFSDSHAYTTVFGENENLQPDQMVPRYCPLGSSEQYRPRLPRTLPPGDHTPSTFSPPFRTSTAIDVTLLPKPLRLKTSVGAGASEAPKAPSSPFVDNEILMSAAIDNDGSLRRSVIMARIKKQWIKGEEPSQTLSSNSHYGGAAIPTPTEQVSRISSAAPEVIYFLPVIPNDAILPTDERYIERRNDLPSPEQWDEDLSPLAKLSAKAQQILGAADLGEIYDFKTSGKNPPLCLCN